MIPICGQTNRPTDGPNDEQTDRCYIATVRSQKLLMLALLHSKRRG